MSFRNNAGAVDWRKIGPIFGVLAIVLLIVLGAPKASNNVPKGSEKLPVLRLGFFPNLTHGPALVAHASKRFETALQGKATLEVKVVNAGPEVSQALLADALDMSYVGPSPALNLYMKTDGKKVRIVDGVCSGGASLVARAGTNITKIEDLAGKRVAVPQLGNTQDVSLRHFLATKGLRATDKGGSVEVLASPNPDTLTLMKKGEVDAAWVPEPWASRLVLEIKATRVLDERDLWPNRQFPTTVLVVRTEFLEKHPDLVQAVVDANDETIKWMKEHQDVAESNVNDELKALTGKQLKPEVLKESWKQLTFETDPLESCFGSFAQAAVDAGYMKDKPGDLSGLFALKGATKGAAKP